MNDRELLELAAKAAGMNIEWQPRGWAHNNETGCEWNPITDDGDALRLAVKLRINVEPVYVWHGPWTNGGTLEDPYAATRLAIVRAAAEIGRNMK
jgi:hypothetical protein